MKQKSLKVLKNFKGMNVKKRRKNYYDPNEKYNYSPPVRIKIIDGKATVTDFEIKIKSKSTKSKPKKRKWKTYSQYLNSKVWNRKRKKALKMYDYKCFHCLEPAENVHHSEYREWGKEKPEDLIPVCKKCHNLLHKR